MDTEERILPDDLALFYCSAKRRGAHIGMVVERMADRAGVYTVKGNTRPAEWIATATGQRLFQPVTTTTRHLKNAW